MKGTSRFWNPAFRSLVAVLGLVCSAGSQAWAQLPTTELKTVFPPGAQAGSTLEVQLSGANLDDVRELRFTHEGIQATPVVQPAGEFDAGPTTLSDRFQITIAPNTPPGIYELRAAGRFGLSNPRAFVVSSVPELPETGTHNTPETAQEISLPVVVNATADRSSKDYYKVHLAQGQRVLIECWAERIDSRMNPTLVIYDSDRKELNRCRRFDGRDPLLDFTAPQEGDYFLEVYDFVYEGSPEHFYRLELRSGPHIDYIFPPSGMPGTHETYTLYGRHLPNSTPATGLIFDGQPLEQVQVQIPVPDQQHDPQLKFADLVRPTNAMRDAISFRYEGSNPVLVYVAQAPVVKEQEPNAADEQVQSITLPCEVVGQFYPARDQDCFEFTAQAGQVFWIEVVAHQLGLESDPFLLVQKVARGENGEVSVTEVAYVDDPGDRNNRIGTPFDTSTDDPSYRLQVAEAGTYRVQVGDHFNSTRQDPRAVYRLILRPEQPDFRLAAYPEAIQTANPNQIPMWTPALRQGGTTLVKVVADRRDGFAGEISLRIEGLPQGVTCAPSTIAPGGTTAWLVLSAADDAPRWEGPIQVVGQATVGEQVVTRTARNGTLIWNTDNHQQTPASYRAAQQLTLSVIDRQVEPARIAATGEQIWETSLGGKLEIPLHVTRRGEFKEALQLAAVGLPDEIKPANVTINGDANDGKLEVLINNANTRPGTYTFFLRSDAKIQYTRNPDAIAAAEQHQQHVAKVLEELNGQLQQDRTKLTELTQLAQQSKQQLEQMRQQKDQLAQAATAAAEQVAQLQQQLEAARKAAEAAPGDSSQQEAIKNMEAAVAQKMQEQQKAAADLAAAETALAEAQQKADESESMRVAAEQAVKASEEKLQRGEQARQAAEKRLNDTKAANGPKELTIALVSLPIQVRVVASPMTIAAQAPSSAVKAGQEIEVPITIERKYGFAEPVEVQLELPGGTAGVAVEKVTIPGDATSGVVKIRLGNDAPVGQLTATLRAKAKFNNVDVAAAQPLALQIEAPPAP